MKDLFFVKMTINDEVVKVTEYEDREEAIEDAVMSFNESENVATIVYDDYDTVLWKSVNYKN